jgi:TolB-like protein
MARRKTGEGKWTKPLGAVLAGLLALLAWNHSPWPGGDPSAPVYTPENSTPSQVYFGPGNSIAVLPFEGGPVEQDQAFWSAGFSDELHRLLIRVTGLQVTSRNSSFYFQDRSVPLRVIAERLQTTHLLTGEFQSTGESVRVSARLFDVKKNRELWSQVYERGLEDVFRIQDEMVSSIVEAVRPGQDRGLPRAEPVDTRAWADYLRGLYLRRQRTLESLVDAEHAFESALDIEPGYEMARIGLAGVWLERGVAGEEGPLVENARDALVTALQSRPELPAALGLLSYIRRNHDWDWSGALEAAEQAIRLAPGDPELMSTASLAMFTLGQFEKAGALLEASVQQDPLNLSRRLRLGLLQEFSGQYEQSLSSYRQIIGLNSQFPGVRAYRARVKIIQEKPDSALRESELEIDPFWKRYSRILALTALDRDEEAKSLLEQMIRDDGHHAAYQVTEILAFSGDAEKAFEWFQRAHDQKDGGMSEILGNYFLRNLHGDPRWEEMLVRVGLPLDLSR